MEIYNFSRQILLYVSVISYNGKSTDRPGQYDLMAEKKLDGF